LKSDIYKIRINSSPDVSVAGIWLSLKKISTWKSTGM
jgi:hypothetical protein